MFWQEGGWRDEIVLCVPHTPSLLLCSTDTGLVMGTAECSKTSTARGIPTSLTGLRRDDEGPTRGPRLLNVLTPALLCECAFTM